MYRSLGCKFCRIAKAELTKLQIPFRSIDIYTDTSSDAVIKQRIQFTQNSSVPQIFIGDELVGGCDDLLSLIAAGKLEEHLSRYQIQQSVEKIQPEIFPASGEEVLGGASSAGVLNESPALSISAALQSKLLQLEDLFIAEVGVFILIAII